MGTFLIRSKKKKKKYFAAFQIMWNHNWRTKTKQSNSTENKQLGERRRKTGIQKNSELNITQRNQEQTEKAKLMVQRKSATLR